MPGGTPNFENILLVALLGGATLWYLKSRQPSKEITYMEFVNQYLNKNQVKMITITEDKSSDMFKYRAEIDSQDPTQPRVYLVLPQVENFLYKLDLSQREMGKMPSEFVPVKYSSWSSQGDNSVVLAVMGLLVVALVLKIYRSR